MDLLAIIWNPSIGIDLGIIQLRYYSLFFALGFLVGYLIIKKIFLQEGLTSSQTDNVLIYAFLGTFIGARLGHVIFYDWGYYSHHLLEIILPFQFEPEFKFIGYQGLASHGAAIAMLISLYLYARKVKRPFLWIMDRVVIPVALAGMFIRLGNLMNSEIVGMPTGDTYGFIFTQNGENFPRHPAQLYEAGCYLLIFLLLWQGYFNQGKGKQMGWLFGAFMVLVFGARFIIEFWKDVQEEFEQGMMLDMGQWLSIPFILAGLYLLLTAGRRPAPSYEKTKPANQKKK